MAHPPEIASDVQYVQVDGMVALKLIKHYEDESAAGNDFIQGILLGMVQENRLEVTNCFALPRIPAPTADGLPDQEAEAAHQRYDTDMVRNLRQVNIDHMHVGWYQSGTAGNFISRTLLDSQLNYQESIAESVVLVYDPCKTSRGHFSLKAYRLNPDTMQALQELTKNEESMVSALPFRLLSPRPLTPSSSPQESSRLVSRLTYERLLVEVPLVIRNSHLINVFLSDLELEWDPRVAHGGDTGRREFAELDLGLSGAMERQLRMLMSGVEDVTSETSKFVMHQRLVAKQQQAHNQFRQKGQVRLTACSLESQILS